VAKIVVQKTTKDCGSSGFGVGFSSGRVEFELA
jgi:hypothetical protein